MSHTPRPSAARESLMRHGLYASKRFGQNFLVDPDIPRRIAEAARLDRDTLAVEIGPGVGALTVALSDVSGAVLALEVDKRLSPIVTETLAGLTNVTVVWQDALKADLTALVATHSRGLTPRLCANLPYAVTTPLLTRLLECQLFDTLTVMVQKEVAERVAAAPGSAAYGAFSLFVQTKARPEILFSVPPGAFYPAPKVTSCVLRLTAAPVAFYDEALFFRLTRAAFSQRRKTLLNALSGVTALSRDELAAALTACGISPMARGETLGIDAYDALCKQVSQTDPG